MTQPGFFDFAAEVGLTKHIGGLGATDALIELCRIGKDSYILDVGCGVGATPCYIAKKVGCRIMGVDISPRMIERSQERARREKLLDTVEFRIADAQALPFEDGMFDAVITESVTAFPADKEKAVNEYARVTKPGGYVGLNETSWLKYPPPPDVLSWAAQEVGGSAKPLTPDAWKELLVGAGLKNVVMEIFAINPEEEERGILQRYGGVGLMGILARMLLLYTRSSAYRSFVKKVSRGGVIPKGLQEYFGYGLFVGLK